MDFSNWDPLDLVQLFFRLLLAIIFFYSSFSKLRQPHQFIVTLASYRLLPKTWNKPIALGIICIEVAVSILLFIGWQCRVAALLTILMLIIFNIAIGVNLGRGHTDLNCGCFGIKHSQKIGVKVLVRNGTLVVAALWILVYGGGIFSLDQMNILQQWAMKYVLPIVLSCLGLSLSFLLAHRLLKILMLVRMEI